MAISKQYMKDWKYDPDDRSSHVARAGLALLPDGIAWRTKNAYKEAFSSDHWKLHGVNSILADANTSSTPPDLPTSQSGQPTGIPDRSTTASGAQCIPHPPDGMVAADASGNALSPIRKPETCVDATARGMKIMQAGTTDRNSGSLGCKQRTSQLWKKINPGCMPDYTSMPISTAHDAFTVDYSCIPPVNKRVHRQKNDFTEHTEQGASIMKALISDKK
eukprot:jgi/Ulvmu1/11758/UM008_0172.1